MLDADFAHPPHIFSKDTLLKRFCTFSEIFTVALQRAKCSLREGSKKGSKEGRKEGRFMWIFGTRVVRLLLVDNMNSHPVIQSPAWITLHD